MNLNNMDIKELKSLAYDVMVNLQNLQNDLITINQVIAKKNQVKTKIVKEEKQEKKGEEK